MAERPVESDALAQGLSIERLPDRRPNPIPTRRGLDNLLSEMSNVRADYDPERLQKTAQTIVDQFPFQSMGLERRPSLITDPSMIQVRVMPDLPVSRSRLNLMVGGDEQITKEFIRDLNRYASSSKHAYVEKEFKKAAQELSALGPGSFKYYMDVGTAAGGGFKPATMRAAIRNVLLMEGFTVVPETATMHPRTRERLLTEKAAKIAISQGKGHPGFMFGMTGPDYGGAHRVATEVLGPSIGLRAPRGVLERLQRAEPTRQFKPEMTGAPEQASSKPITQAIKELRAFASSKRGSGVDAIGRSRRIMDLLKEGLSENDQQRMLSILDEDPVSFARRFASDPAKAVVRPLAVLRSGSPDIDLSLRLEDRRRLADAIEEAVTIKKKVVPVTRATKALEETAHVTQEAAERVYREEANRLSKFVPGMKGRIGPAGPILAIAALLSAGMFAAGMTREDAA